MIGSAFRFELMRKCLLAPNLNHFYRNGVKEPYRPFFVEKVCNYVIKSILYCAKWHRFIVPIIAVYAVRGHLKSSGSHETAHSWLAIHYIILIVVNLMICYLIRSYCRSVNQQFVKFLQVLDRVPFNGKPIPSTIKNQLLMFDFDFESWPIEFSLAKKRSIFNGFFNFTIPSNIFSSVLNLPLNVIAYLAIHTFGIRLIYPGSLIFVYYMLQNNILSGRRFLINSCDGQRFKLETADGNCIDSMFIDNRNRTSNGKTLVICSEGNSGFYEIGIMHTPIQGGYSVLGWNHPGFACSTGVPYPDQEKNAIDAVVRFAIDSLGFMPHQIVLFGWSIGGYSSTWAAQSYPGIKGVILDATFDDLYPLAVNVMPAILKPIVRKVVDSYANLNIGELICGYPGPVNIIRRTNDEILCTKYQDLTTNRGNDLLCKLLKYRYPLIFGERQVAVLRDFLKITGLSENLVYRKYDIDCDLFRAMFKSYAQDYGRGYPMMVGENIDESLKDKLVIFLAITYMKDLKATHCEPLPIDCFKIPENVFA